MVTAFAAAVEKQAVEMSAAPEAVVEIHVRTRAVVHVVCNNVRGALELRITGALLFPHTKFVAQIESDEVLAWLVSRAPIKAVSWGQSIVAPIRIAPQSHRSRASPDKFVVRDGCIAIVGRKKDCVPVDALKYTAAHIDALRDFKKHNGRAFERPVSSARNSVRVHKRVHGVAESKADETYVADGSSLRTARDVKEVLLGRGDEARGWRGRSWGRVEKEVERFCRRVKVVF